MAKKPKVIEAVEDVDEKRQKCVIIMPISSFDNCSENHCNDVLALFTEAIDEAGFEPVAAWVNPSSEIIHRKIIENIMTAPIAICDVSGQNPNVMFELGLRLSSGKPTIIVKDKETSFCFDTGLLHHEEYPRELRMNEMREFLSTLKESLRTAHEEYSEGKYTGFLKSLGGFKVDTVDTINIPPAEVTYETVKQISDDVAELKSTLGLLPAAMLQAAVGLGGLESRHCLKRLPNDKVDTLRAELENMASVKLVRKAKVGTHFHFNIEYNQTPNLNKSKTDILNLIQSYQK